MPRTKEEHWAYKALRKRLAEKTETITYPDHPRVEGEPRILSKITTPDWELGNIFLFDPDAKRDIEKNFQLVYADILAVFENERFVIPSSFEINLREKCDQEASCSTVFIVRDSKRPALGEGSPWWFIRFSLDLREGAGYSLLSELHLSLPFWLESDWALDFMVGARKWPDPPTLTVDHNEFSLRFERCNRGWLSFGDASSEMEKFLSPFRVHSEIAKAVDLFSKNPGNRFIKCYMLEAIKDFYGVNP